MTIPSFDSGSEANYRGSVQHLSRDEFVRRARRIRLVLTDNDGVLTDTGVYYGEHGEAFKRYSIRDGMGVERLRAAGIMTGIVTGERSENLAQRARKLAIVHLHLGVRDKLAVLSDILRQSGCAMFECAFIGDDVNDHAVMSAIAPHGLIAAPADAMPGIRAIAQYVCGADGGHGAFRDFAEAVLDARRE